MAILAALGMSVPAIASADSTMTSAPTTSTTVHVDHSSTTPWKTWRKAENAYLAQLHVINRTFRVSVNVARREYHLAIRASVGSANRQAARAAARAALTLSIANAMQARATALTALGAPPAPPAGTPREIVVLNAGVALYAADVAGSIPDGIDRARAAIASGAAPRKSTGFA